MPRIRVVPNMVQEEWDRRREKRILYVAEVEAMCLLGVGGQLPPHPDPEDRGLSKRAWEKLIYKWKEALRMQGYVLPGLGR